MSLPVIKSLADCVDFNKTVLSFIPQLYDLPQHFFQFQKDFDPSTSLSKYIYLSTNPLISAFAFCLFTVPIFIIAAEVNKNYSQVDRFWSLLPTFYILHFTLYAHTQGLPTQRLDIVAFISILWSIRLTHNYWRKGGYSIGSEDYRWAVLRKKINPPLFFVLNVVFIALIQSILLLSITTPAYLLLLAANQTQGLSGLSDLVFPTALVSVIFLTYWADLQQWNFHVAKQVYRESPEHKVLPGYYEEDLRRGFNCTGLWSLSRHPNFLAEQSFWVLFYAYAASITTQNYYYFNWTIVAPISYVILFQLSTWFTESITASKYPEYKEYQNRVGKFFPIILGGGGGGGGGLPGDFRDKRPASERSPLNNLN